MIRANRFARIALRIACVTKIEKFKIALRDWKFQARLNISSKPTNPKICGGILKVKIESFKQEARLNISSEIEFVHSLGPYADRPREFTRTLLTARPLLIFCAFLLIVCYSSYFC